MINNRSWENDTDGKPSSCAIITVIAVSVGVGDHD
jgi:hypothetical protein